MKERSSRAVNFLPFHGRQPGPVKRRRCRREDRPRGAEVSLKDELSLTHTLALFLTSALSSCHPHTLFHSPLTHTLPSSSPLTPNFCSFPFTHSTAILPDAGDPLVSPSPEAPTYPREPCCGTTRVAASEPKVPSFISSHFGEDEREIPGIKERITGSHKSRATE